MDASTRPPQKRHQTKGHLALGLVAVFLVSSSPVYAAFDIKSETLPILKSIPPAPAAHNIGITVVPFGEETLQLSARFSESNDYPIQGVHWLVRNSTDGILFDGKAAITDAHLPAGEYLVEANYGAVHLLEPITLQAGTKLEVDFILNAGRLRVLPNVEGVGFPATGCRNMVYALNGIARGQLVATSHTPGEVINLHAGTYRIESRFDDGNAAAVTDVTIKAGIMSAVTITHKAGIAIVPDITDAKWSFTTEQGEVLAPLSNSGHELVLKPGNYVASAFIAGQKRETKFSIEAGQTHEINLAP
jgi:hypothetical protein